MRGLLAEFGLVFAEGAGPLQGVLSEVLEDAGSELGTLARLTPQRAQSQWRELDAHLARCDERVAAHAKGNDAVRAAAALMGIGPVTASAVVATVGDFKQFRCGAQFGACIGLTPSQHSSGGKIDLGGITKRGDTYLRTLLIQVPTCNAPSSTALPRCARRRPNWRRSGCGQHLFGGRRRLLIVTSRGRAEPSP
jgi:transposase